MATSARNQMTLTPTGAEMNVMRSLCAVSSLVAMSAVSLSAQTGGRGTVEDGACGGATA